MVFKLDSLVFLSVIGIGLTKEILCFGVDISKMNSFESRMLEIIVSL